jgi:hypothetical protein
VASFLLEGTSETTEKTRFQPIKARQRQRQLTVTILIELQTFCLSTCIKRKLRWKKNEETKEGEEDEGLYLIT